VEFLLRGILKLCLAMMKKSKGNTLLRTRTVTTLALAAVLTISVLNNNSFSTIASAFADGRHNGDGMNHKGGDHKGGDHKGGGSDQIPTVVTTPLEGLSLDEAQFLLLSDTTPVRVGAAHIALNVPCDENGDSNVAVVAGVAPDLQLVELELVPELTFSQDNCMYHADIPNNRDEVTDIAIVNIGTELIQFTSGNFATLSISEVSY
jgi:hypothetical protein